jgi:acyl-CoA dehydrogenase
MCVVSFPFLEVNSRSLIHVLLFQGPDAVHLQQVGQSELKRATALRARHEQMKRKEEALVSKWGVKARL